MRISIKVKPGAKQEKIEKIQNNIFKISIKETPEKGQANKAVIKLLANYLNISFLRIKIISGLKSKEKIIEIS